MVFYSKIASEQNEFDITDVLNTVCEKLIERHPHIYGDVKVENEQQVKENWEKIKLSEEQLILSEKEFSTVKAKQTLTNQYIIAIAGIVLIGILLVTRRA